MYLIISQISVARGRREEKKTWKIAENRHVSTESNSRISTRYEGLWKTDIMSCHSLDWAICRISTYLLVYPYDPNRCHSATTKKWIGLKM